MNSTRPSDNGGYREGLDSILPGEESVLEGREQGGEEREGAGWRREEYFLQGQEEVR